MNSDDKVEFIDLTDHAEPDGPPSHDRLGARSSRPATRTPARSLREEHTADTRRVLVETATELFAAKGYEATSTPEILEAARVSRGSLYHHFDSKAGLFAAVLEAVEADFIDRLAEAGAPGDDIWEQVANGCQAFLDVSLEAPVRQIVLIDGPAVLGWDAWRQIEERYGLGLLRQFLRRAIDAGLIPEYPIDALVHTLTGALNEAATYVAHAPDPAAARIQAGEVVGALLAGLRANTGAFAET